MGDHQQTEVGLAALQVGQYRASVVARAVVGDDDLEVTRQSAEHPGDMPHGALDDGLLVVRRKHR